MGDIELFSIFKVCHHDISTPMISIVSILIPSDETQGQVDLFFTEAYEGKKLSSQYLHTYNLYYLHINTSGPYEKTQVQRLVTLTYLSSSQRPTNEINVMEISSHYIVISSILIPVIHLMKLKGKFKEWWLWRGLIKEKTLSSRYIHPSPTIYIASILIPVIHIMKLKVKHKDGWPWPIFQGHKGW